MVKIAMITDIHIGAQETDKLYNQLKNCFYEPMKEYKPDIIFDLGDTTHTKLFIHSDDAALFLDYGATIKSLAKDVLIVFGTYSHVYESYKVYKHLIDEHFRIIYKAEDVDINKLNILVLPEEYDVGKDYYDKFFNKKYDFIIGHAMFAHIGYYIKDLTNIIQSKHAKVWKWEEFTDKSYGGCYFGHIHSPSDYKGITYPGSFSRTCFGEEEPKGILLIEYDEIKKKIKKKEFIENTLAPKYKDIYVKDLPKDLDSLNKHLRKESEENFKIRVIIDENIEESYLNNIMGFTKSHLNTSIIKKIPKILTEKEEKAKEKEAMILEKVNKYKNKDFYEITKTIAKEQYFIDFTNEEINEILNN